MTDWRSAGAKPLELKRFYSSQSNALATPVQSRLGNAWRTNFDAAATWTGQLSAARLIHIVLPDSSEHSFSFQRGVWTAVRPRLLHGSIFWDQPFTGKDMSLTVGADITLRLQDGTRYVFNMKGQLLKIQYPDEYWQMLAYTGDINTRVTDSLGRWLEFIYAGTRANPPHPPTLVTTVRTSDGQIYRYTYEDRISVGEPEYNNNTTSLDRWVLKMVAFPDATPAVTTDNPTIIYDYLPSTVRPYLLTSSRDESGVLTAAWTYDSKGRATSSWTEGEERPRKYLYDDTSEALSIASSVGRSAVESGSDRVWRSLSSNQLEKMSCPSPSKDCHAYCTEKCIGVGLGSDAPFCYWKCMRECGQW